MQVLIETRMNSLKLNESKAPKKGCLGRLEGVCADFKNPTRNGRLYTLDLWKKVFDDALFKESLENKTLFGELDHPEDRFEPLMSKACVVMTDYTIDEDKGLIYGGFDILDTPDGRILKSILDYGSVVGVSSRGQGDIIESVDGEQVDCDSYEFACFDVVSTPAVEKARQKRVAESLKRINRETFTESVKRQIDEAETVADLNVIRAVVRSSDVDASEIDSLVESIEDKCKALQNVGETISTVTEKVETELTSPTLEEAKTIRDKKALYQCIKGLREKVSAYKHRESRYVESLHESNDKIQELQEEVQALRKTISSSRRQTESLKSNLNKTITESKKTARNSDNELRQLRIINAKLQEEKADLTENIKQLKRNLVKYSSNSKQKISELQRLLHSSKTEINSLNEQMQQDSSDYNDNLKSMDCEIDDYTRLLDEAVDRLSDRDRAIESLTDDKKRLQESLDKSQAQSTKLGEQLKKFQQSYVSQLCKTQGISESSVKTSITSTTTPEQVDRLIEGIRNDIDSTNKLPITMSGIVTGGDYLIESVTTRKGVTDEDELVSHLKYMQSQF